MCPSGYKKKVTDLIYSVEGPLTTLLWRDISWFLYGPRLFWEVGDCFLHLIFPLTSEPFCRKWSQLQQKKKTNEII